MVIRKHFKTADSAIARLVLAPPNAQLRRGGFLYEAAISQDVAEKDFHNATHRDGRVFDVPGTRIVEGAGETLVVLVRVQQGADCGLALLFQEFIDGIKRIMKRAGNRDLLASDLIESVNQGGDPLRLRLLQKPAGIRPALELRTRGFP